VEGRIAHAVELGCQHLDVHSQPDPAVQPALDLLGVLLQELLLVRRNPHRGVDGQRDQGQPVDDAESDEPRIRMNTWWRSYFAGFAISKVA
jgi:hypothetical protein